MRTIRYLKGLCNALGRYVPEEDAWMGKFPPIRGWVFRIIPHEFNSKMGNLIYYKDATTYWRASTNPLRSLRSVLPTFPVVLNPEAPAPLQVRYYLTFHDRKLRHALTFPGFRTNIWLSSPMRIQLLADVCERPDLFPLLLDSWTDLPTHMPGFQFAQRFHQLTQGYHSHAANAN